jgi:hypothetical protein
LVERKSAARIVGEAVLSVLELGVLLVEAVLVLESLPPPQAAKVQMKIVERIRRKELIGVLVSDFIKV